MVTKLNDHQIVLWSSRCIRLLPILMKNNVVRICNDMAQFKSYEKIIKMKILMGTNVVAHFVGQSSVKVQFISEKKLDFKHYARTVM